VFEQLVEQRLTLGVYLLVPWINPQLRCWNSCQDSSSW